MTTLIDSLSSLTTKPWFSFRRKSPINYVFFVSTSFSTESLANHGRNFSKCNGWLDFIFIYPDHHSLSILPINTFSLLVQGISNNRINCCLLKAHFQNFSSPLAGIWSYATNHCHRRRDSSVDITKGISYTRLCLPKTRNTTHLKSINKDIEITSASM